MNASFAPNHFYLAIFTMNLLTIISIVVAVSLLKANAQAPPYREGAIILNDVCLPREDLASRVTDEGITNIASRLVNGSVINNCLDMIYVMAFTSDLLDSTTTHSHNIEVVAAGQTRRILLPDRPGDYEAHKGDIWKLHIINDLGFPAGSCIKICNIESVTIVEAGGDGWNIDSVVTYGCIDGLGCKPITQDIDAFRWVDGNDSEVYNRFPLTKISGTFCTL